MLRLGGDGSVYFRFGQVNSGCQVRLGYVSLCLVISGFPG
jgi:hypothetical protein